MNNWTEWRDAPPCDFAVVGDPIHHSKSPLMHSAAYAALGLNLTYSAVRVPLEEFEEAVAHLKSLGVKGVNCTLPLKGAARAWAEARGGLKGEEIGCHPGPNSVNTLNLTDQTGISTDEAGFLALVKEAIPEEGKPKILILGAGGTGQALAYRLIQEGWPVHLWNRTPGKWEAALAAMLGPAVIQTRPNLKEMQVVVNATSTELQGGRLDLDWSQTSGDVLAIDLLYGKETSFLREASRSGLKTRDGSVMLMEQGALSFEWWLNQPAPRSAMLQAIHGHSSANK